MMTRKLIEICENNRLEDLKRMLDYYNYTINSDLIRNMLQITYIHGFSDAAYIILNHDSIEELNINLLFSYACDSTVPDQKEFRKVFFDYYKKFGKEVDLIKIMKKKSINWKDM